MPCDTCPCDACPCGTCPRDTGPCDTGPCDACPHDTCPLCLLAVPAAPDAPVPADVFADHCTLSWTPPTDDGGAPITGFHVEKRIIGSQRWARVNKEQV
jgi:hypothetical protein